MSHAISTPSEPEVPASVTAADTPVNAAENVAPALSLDDALDNLVHYRSRPIKGFNVLRDNTDLCADPRVAAVFVECAVAAGRLDLARMVIPFTPDDTGVLSAMIHMADHKPKRALAALKAMPTDTRHKVYALGLQVQANVMIGAYEAASKAVNDWSLDMPSSPQPYRVMGNALAKKGDKRADRWFKRAINVSGGGSGAVLDYASYLIKLGRTDQARECLDSLRYVKGRTKRRKQKLLNAL